MSIVQAAKELAHIAHQDQFRKYTGMPYIDHPREVVALIRKYVEHVTDEMLAAAWLHDVVEDQDVSYHDIESATNQTVASYVWHLTDTPKFVGNRARRKHMDRVRLGNAPAEVQTIKYADLLSNSRDIFKHDKDFAQVFLREKAAMLMSLNSGDKVLKQQAINALHIMEANFNG